MFDIKPQTVNLIQRKLEQVWKDNRELVSG